MPLKILSGIKKAYGAMQAGKAAKDTLSSKEPKEKPIISFKMIAIMPIVSLVLLLITPFIDKSLEYNSMYGADSSVANASQANTNGNSSSVKYVDWALKISEDASHGYTMGALGPDEFDCQGLVKAALKEAGYDNVYDVWGFASDGTGTSAAPDGLKALGFTQHDYNADELKPGDILLKTAYGSGHVAIYVGDGHSVDAMHDLPVPGSGTSAENPVVYERGDSHNGQGINNEEIGLFDLSYTAWQYYFRAP